MAQALLLVIVFDPVAGNATANAHEKLERVGRLEQIDHVTFIVQVLAILDAIALEQQSRTGTYTVHLAYRQRLNELEDSVPVALELELTIRFVDVRAKFGKPQVTRDAFTAMTSLV